MQNFATFGLLPTLGQTLAEKNLRHPTEIQTLAIPRLLQKVSLIAVSETGSGKTLAFVIPILHQIKSFENSGDPIIMPGSPRALVMVPTRELGEQVAKVFKPFTHATRLRVRTVLGGTPLAMAKRNVAGPFDILVATPGRTLQLLDQKLLHLEDLRFLVFDEADQMLDPGFKADAVRIVSACASPPQMALFSATFSDEVEGLAKTLFGEIFHEALILRSRGSHHTVPTLVTQHREVADGKRFPHLEKILRKPVSGGTLIFTNTRDQCDQLAETLRTAGQPCAIYRGEMEKVERRANLKAFREGKVPVLISTDLASRGLDVEHVTQVINYHLPQQIENYLHRVGRTARAGRTGTVINLVTERDQPLIRQLERMQRRS